MNTETCGPQHANAYLNGDLAPQQEQQYVKHLDSCASCREHLESVAAGDDIWRDVRELLLPKTAAAGNSETGVTDDSRLPVSIQQVVRSLQPTDDPKSMGRIDNFEVMGVVGSGAMGVVLKARDTSLDRIVALKVMNPALASSGTARSRFEREAKAAAAIHHHNVVAIHGVQTSTELPYLVMPYLKGVSLQQRVDHQGPFSLAEILRIGSQIAAGLAAAHQQGVVHRDIKPSNVMLDNGVETAVITDFGLARIVDDATMTRTGVISGTPEFMSPEQARGDVMDGKSDMFSLGSVLYMLGTGYPPFRAQTSVGVLRRITDDTPRSIRQLNPEIPVWLCTIIENLLRKDPASRPTAIETQVTLERCLAHVYQPDQVALPVDFRDNESKPFPFRPVLLGVITMILAATVLAFLVFYESDNQKATRPDKLMPTTISKAGEGASGALPDSPDASSTAQQHVYKKEFQLAFADPSAAGQLEVDLSRGSIQVTGHASNAVVVRLSVPQGAPGQTKDAKGLSQVRPQNFDFDIERSGNHIKVDSNSRRYVTNVEILVPLNTQLDLDSYQDGKLEVRNIVGKIRARSQHNDIVLIDVDNCVDLSSRQGNLSATFKSAEKLAGSSLETYNGSIDLALPADLNATVRYLSRAGRVLTDFDLNTSEGALNVASPAERDFKIEFDKFVTGTINGGGAELKLETTNGDIRLRRQK